MKFKSQTVITQITVFGQTILNEQELYQVLTNIQYHNVYLVSKLSFSIDRSLKINKNVTMSPDYLQHVQLKSLHLTNDLYMYLITVT